MSYSSVLAGESMSVGMGRPERVFCPGLRHEGVVPYGGLLLWQKCTGVLDRFVAAKGKSSLEISEPDPIKAK